MWCTLNWDCRHFTYLTLNGVSLVIYSSVLLLACVGWSWIRVVVWVAACRRRSCNAFTAKVAGKRNFLRMLTAINNILCLWLTKPCAIKVVYATVRCSQLQNNNKSVRPGNTGMEMYAILVAWVTLSMRRRDRQTDRRTDAPLISQRVDGSQRGLLRWWKKYYGDRFGELWSSNP